MRRSLERLEVEQRRLQSEITKSEDGERTRTMALFESYDQPLSLFFLFFCFLFFWKALYSQ